MELPELNFRLWTWLGHFSAAKQVVHLLCAQRPSRVLTVAGGADGRLVVASDATGAMLVGP
jgi:hypothetical protein